MNTNIKEFSGIQGKRRPIHQPKVEDSIETSMIYHIDLDWFSSRLKMQFLCFFGCFWAYVGQPYTHISWATSMPYASINPTNPRTNLWNFRKIFLRIGDFENLIFFESAIFIFFFQKKNASFLWKSVQIYIVEWMGWHFDVFLVSRKFLAVRNITLYSQVWYWVYLYVATNTCIWQFSIQTNQLVCKLTSKPVSWPDSN